MALDRILFRLEVSETDRTRAYWAAKPWATGELRDQIGSADLVIVPWEEFRQDKPALFPEGASDIIRTLCAELAGNKVVVGIDRDKYEEIALYANEWRLPTVVCTVLIIPLLNGVLANHIDRWTMGLSRDATVEMEVIAEGAQGRCFSLKYKGPPNKLIDNLSEQMKQCFEPARPAQASKKPRR
jgi:hypothetical protein